MDNLINKPRLIATFCDLVAIDSLSYQERELANELIKRLYTLGLCVSEDDAGKKIGGTAGNVIAKLKGNAEKEAILFSAHMDTVDPGAGKKPLMKGNRIQTDGSTVLGGDDVTGIACILEMLQVLQEQNLLHGDIYVIFTIAEEMGLQGAKNLNFDFLEDFKAKYGFVLDDFGKAGAVVSHAPSHVKIKANIIGKSVHAGVEPEKGIDAIRIFADAVYHMKLGRIDEETTANIGIVSGGNAMNTVCGQIVITGEVRSRDEGKLESHLCHMRDCLEKAAKKFGGKIEFNDELLYSSINLHKRPELVSLLERAAGKINLELDYRTSGGGSDANILNGLGIPSVNLSAAYNSMHTTQEYVEVDEMIKLSKLIISITQSV